MICSTSGHSRTTTRRRGVTLVEATLSMIVVGVMLVAALKTLGAAARRHRVRNDREIALALAHELMSETLAVYYTDPEDAEAGDPAGFGPEPDETTTPDNRAGFDDLDDYDGWVETPPRTRDGIPLAGLEGWSRTVLVAQIDPDELGANGASDAALDTGLRRITVLAGRPDGMQVRLEALRGIYGYADIEPAVESTTVKRIGMAIQIGEDGVPLHASTTMLNHPAAGDAP
jgi:type II secretory pathway pseudopilin PulG